MKEIYGVTYRVQVNLYRSYPQNANRHVRVRCVRGYENAIAFAKTVDTIRIFDGCGRNVKF